MLRRRLTLLFLCALPLSAGVWQNKPGPWKLHSTTLVRPQGDAEIWREYGFKAAEKADFGRFQVTAYQFDDSTGAYAASLLPDTGKPRVFGSYALVCSGACPAAGRFPKLLEYLPGRTGGALPTLGSYLPVRERVAGSERYITGPVALSRFAPRIPAATAGFQFSAEAETAKYQTRAGDAELALFSYPAPQMARSQYNGFRKLSGVFAKRTGSLVAVVSGIGDKNAAWDILNQINIELAVTMNEAASQTLQAKSLANMVLSIFALAGILIVFCLASGLLFAGGRVLLKRFGITGAGEAMTILRLGDK